MPRARPPERSGIGARERRHGAAEAQLSELTEEGTTRTARSCSWAQPQPGTKAYQQAMFQQGQPAAMFFNDDVQADHERMEARGAGFTMPPTDVTGSRIAMLNDTCGNLIQITQLKRW